MRDLGLVKFDEPFANLLTQGMVLNHVFLRVDGKGKRTFFAPEELDIVHDDAGRVTGARSKADGQPVEYAGISTMSKSSRNGVDPQELIDRYGADTARFFIIFTSPPEQTLEWSDAGVEGSFRFLRRVWSFAHDLAPVVQAESAKRKGAYSGYRYSPDWARNAPEHAAARREIHLSLKQATYDIQRMQFNTVASAAMKIYNALSELARDPAVPGREGHAQVLHEGLSILLRVMSPITPHIAHVLWKELGFEADPLMAQLARGRRVRARDRRDRARPAGERQAARPHAGAEVRRSRGDRAPRARERCRCAGTRTASRRRRWSWCRGAS